MSTSFCLTSSTATFQDGKWRVVHFDADLDGSVHVSVENSHETVNFQLTAEDVGLLHTFLSEVRLRSGV